ncbi:MAG TPA: Asp23/Gls24 family envelope stress response protein [Thermomicrobiaceae bacterium]|nr:Asp23/Gls24 family envelope stress response protein [Thermomicrobiaceae bacterium]
MAQAADRTAGEQVREQGNSLVTEHGKTTIENTVVAKIAAIATREVAGVHDLVSQGIGGTISGLAQQVTGNDLTQGVSVQVGQHETNVNLAMVVNYGVSIPQVADAVRNNIINRIQSMTGLHVREVNIDVTDLYMPQQQQGHGAGANAGQQTELH